MYDFNAAVSKFESGAYQEAVEALERSIALAPDSAEAHLYMGMSLIKLERHDEAVASLESAREHGLTNGEPEYFTAVAMRSKGNHAEAKRIWEELAKSCPYEWVRLRSQAWVEFLGHRFAECIALCEWIDADAGDHEPPFTCHVQALIRNKEYEKAKAVIRRALGVTLEKQSYYYFQGICEYYLGNTREAIAAFETCLRIDPDHENCLRRLGHLYFKTWRLRDMLRVIKEIVRLENRGTRWAD